MTSSDPLWQLKNDYQEFKQQLEQAEQALEENPDDAEVMALKQSLEEAIAEIEPLVTAQSPAASAPVNSAPAPSPPSGAAVQTSASSEPQTKSYKVNDTVMARWRKDFYPARITSIVGPLFYVKYQGYEETGQVRVHDLKPYDSKKQTGSKAESIQGLPNGTSTPTPPVAKIPTGTISAAPSVNPGLVNKRKEPMMATDGPPKPQMPSKKIKGQKELEAKKNSWKSFQSAGKGKGAKKDSMFRTGNSVNARVGFTGSGQDMRKDPSKSRHNFEYADEY